MYGVVMGVRNLEFFASCRLLIGREGGKGEGICYWLPGDGDDLETSRIWFVQGGGREV
jgi:hypothetical protein